MKSTKIEWSEKVWNPSVGCDKISAGCKFCYAEQFAQRLKAMGIKDYEEGFKFKILPHRLNEPFTIKKPTIFFVNSMSDLFHKDMPFDYLDQILDTIRRTPQHIYQILTKREQVMSDYFTDKEVPNNVWLGVTVENEANVYRAEVLKSIKAKTRFISFEPLLGSVGQIDLTDIHWAIVGGESGVNARPMKKEWVQEIFDQCRKYNTAFFFKQWGTWNENGEKKNKKANGRYFNGKIWNEYPDKV